MFINLQISKKRVRRAEQEKEFTNLKKRKEDLTKQISTLSAGREDKVFTFLIFT